MVRHRLYIYLLFLCYWLSLSYFLFIIICCRYYYYFYLFYSCCYWSWSRVMIGWCTKITPWQSALLVHKYLLFPSCLGVFLSCSKLFVLCFLILYPPWPCTLFLYCVFLSLPESIDIFLSLVFPLFPLFLLFSAIRSFLSLLNPNLTGGIMSEGGDPTVYSDWVCQPKGP